MMFINPRHVDVDCYDEDDTEIGKQHGGRHRSLRQQDGYGQNGYLQVKFFLISKCQKEQNISKCHSS